jgi:hypothetical protein
MSEVYALEKQLSEGKLAQERRALALKLHANPDFKKLILEEFCVTECARYAQLSGDPSLDKTQQADALALAQAAGHLRRFLSVVVTLGNNAEAREEEIEQAILEARQEEDIEGSTGVDPE